MKVQLLDLVEDSNQLGGGGSVSFFNELDKDNELCSLLSVSFFNEILKHKVNYAHDP
jgi:hypothetical protein